MPVKKPGGMGNLTFSMERKESFHLSDTGTFSQDNFAFGRNGITKSPVSLGEVSNLRLDDLQLGPILGRGNSSKVYLATHQPTGQPLALKVLQEDIEHSQGSRHQVLAEVKTVFNAKSDHLVAFYDAFLHDGSIHLALEYMDLGSLEGAISAAVQSPDRRMPEAVVAHVLLQMLQGLTYLHKERHSVHRDLKPANILINSAGFVKLSDFGISKELNFTQGQAATHCGTLAYMSPERIRGELYSFSADLWSLGLIALEMSCGGYPYPVSQNYFDTVKNIVDGPLPTETPQVGAASARADAKRLRSAPAQRALLTGVFSPRWQVQAALAPDLLQLVHAAIDKDPACRPDISALLRHPFIARYQVSRPTHPPPPIAARSPPTRHPQPSLSIQPTIAIPSKHTPIRSPSTRHPPTATHLVPPIHRHASIGRLRQSISGPTCSL